MKHLAWRVAKNVAHQRAGRTDVAIYSFFFGVDSMASFNFHSDWVTQVADDEINSVHFQLVNAEAVCCFEAANQKQYASTEEWLKCPSPPANTAPIV